MKYADQADRLRRLVMDADEGDTAGDDLPLIVLAGGKGGVGVTTVSVNLSIALADRGLNVALVDANLHQPDVAALCGIHEKGTLQEVLSGRRTIQEVMQRGPSGIHVVPGAWAPDDCRESGVIEPKRLRTALRRIAAQADAIIVDVGSTPGPLARACWHDARLAVVVTVPDTVAVMDAYATLKLHAADVPPAGVRVMVNRGAGNETEVVQRIGRACERFLGLEVQGWPSIPDEPQVSQCQRPIALELPTSPVAHAYNSLAEHVEQLLSCTSQGRSLNSADPIGRLRSADASVAS